MSTVDYRDDLHHNGVHVECVPLRPGKSRGDGTHRRCSRAGTIERVHGHDYDGLLVCGCDELDA